MGQTLSHGVYLPAEGERNCYDGLASNWNILDGSVGTIAEHTTALAGKAPAVHTHTKSDITDFPAYGNTAGTICEGNDSRLSDARTPTAHTHTKSEVTDLLNSNFIPSANNTYDLGSSSYQWNNVYSKGVNTQTLNGINPGALSLPSGGTTANTDWFNVAGDILPTGGNATSFNRATANYFIPAKDGWLALAVKNCSELSVWCDTLKYGISIVAPDASVNRQTVIPVVAGKSYQILITGNSWISARLIMPQGNV